MVGRALTSISSFTGAATEDYNNHIRDFQGKIGPQGYAILLAFWTNELFLKLEGPAKSWYNTTYTAQNIRPEREDLTAGLQRLFGRRYTAADARRQFCVATRQPHESGPAALQRIQELLSALMLLNVPATPGPTKQMCYILQDQLTKDEKRCWIAARLERYSGRVG